ncbi:DeoR/GlpR family DNA-binding transcription regulator [Sphingobium nicotianae]|uniref:DeoR/GlpR family DNA-binding transcription regulator n=1 Tax=Sphingobium nicotianae TaxID=2782607 RepID=A0A9X1ISP3_9SPHN|nr:DeoR/GlpR family DNA-binding transcription regulator [Sphingobium nicotianae]MBT2188791.1 DeoR/GlpR family DNA-binding transcription regulator [Sphingobium nicotianae]
MGISPVKRQRQIVEIARNVGKVTVDDLATRLSVTPQTIRKDLNELCARNLLSRVHGGALLGSGVENLEYEARRQLAEAEKRRIGEAAAALIPDGASLFINIGTTTEEVARQLAERSGFLVITNNLNVVDILGANPDIELIVVGGRLRHRDRATVGPSAVEFIKNFKVDFAIIGASAIDEDGSLLDFDFSEVQVSHAIMQNSRSVILVADQMKLGRKAPIRIGHLSQIDIFVTDYAGSPKFRRVCEESDVRVVTVSV